MVYMDDNVMEFTKKVIEDENNRANKTKSWLTDSAIKDIWKEL